MYKDEWIGCFVYSVFIAQTEIKWNGTRCGYFCCMMCFLYLIWFNWIIWEGLGTCENGKINKCSLILNILYAIPEPQCHNVVHIASNPS